MAEPSLEGWDIGRADELEWIPWGSRGDARAKILGQADGYVVALVQAEPGYKGDPHEHAHAEFNYVVEGAVRNQGRQMTAGDGYAAAAGSTQPTSRPGPAPPTSRSSRSSRRRL